jgi:hypothetical protein
MFPATSEGNYLSYDYMLGKGDATLGFEAFMESASSGVIAREEPLKASITKLFPSVRWEQFAINSPIVGTRASWFGRPAQPGPPEFYFSPEPDGQVRLLSMCRCERSEVELVARTLGVVAFDEQTMEVFGG